MASLIAGPGSIASPCGSGHRSLRDLRRLNIVSGADRSGTSSLYRALRLPAEVAPGRLIRSGRPGLDAPAGAETISGA